MWIQSEMVMLNGRIQLVSDFSQAMSIGDVMNKRHECCFVNEICLLYSKLVSWADRFLLGRQRQEQTKSRNLHEYDNLRLP